MKTTRRDLLKFAGGCAAGALLTPLPWRAVADTAILTQTWPGVPIPARGEVSIRATNCALCTAGCPVQARMIGEHPISLIGKPGSPLCALGLAGHQMPYHAGRVLTGDPERAAAAIREARGAIAVLDLRPDRTASWTYRRAMRSIPNGLYIKPQRLLQAVNLSAAKTVVSFGVPVLDGWGTPGNVLALRDQFELIRLAANDPPAAALSKKLRPPVLVLSANESPDQLNLNARFGALGVTVIKRTEVPVPPAWSRQAAPVTYIANVPEQSIGALLIDESAPDLAIPWNAIAPKLAPNAVVVTFTSSLEGYARYSHHVLPVSVYPERVEDIPPAIDSVQSTFRVTTPLVTAPNGMVDPATFIARLANLDASNALKERAEAAGKVTGQPIEAPDWDEHVPPPAICPAVRPKPPLFTKLYQESGLKGVAS